MSAIFRSLTARSQDIRGIMQLSSAQQLLTLCCCFVFCFCLSLHKALPDHMLADQHKRKPGGCWRRASGTLAFCSLTRIGYPSDPELLQPRQCHRQPRPVPRLYTCYLFPDPAATPSRRPRPGTTRPPGTQPLATSRWSRGSPASVCRALGRSGVLSELSSSSFPAGPRSRGLMTPGEQMCGRRRSANRALRRTAPRRAG